MTRAVITLEGGTYYGLLAVAFRNEAKVFDCRSSDSIALDVHFKAPIIVERDLLNSAGRVLGSRKELIPMVKLLKRCLPVLFFAVALYFTAADRAAACPFCNMEGKTLTGEVKDATMVLSGQPANPNPEKTPTEASARFRARQNRQPDSASSTSTRFTRSGSWTTSGTSRPAVSRGTKGSRSSSTTRCTS